MRPCIVGGCANETASTLCQEHAANWKWTGSVMGPAFGSWTIPPSRVGRLDGDDPRHGTINGYCNHGCRCIRCAGAARLYQRKYRAEVAAMKQRRAERLTRVAS